VLGAGTAVSLGRGELAPLGAFNSVQAGLLELRGDRALLSYYQKSPTWYGAAGPRDEACDRSIRRLEGYDVCRRPSLGQEGEKDG
jgi:hypothetical protein